MMLNALMTLMTEQLYDDPFNIETELYHLQTIRMSSYYI